MLQPKEYTDSLALSQSDVKLFRKSMIQFFQTVEQRMEGISIRSKATDIGDVIDCMETNPSGLDDYHVIPGVDCSENIREIITQSFALASASVKELHEDAKEIFLKDFNKIKGFILQVAREKEYRKNYGDDKLLEVIWKDGGILFSNMALSATGYILDQALYDKAKAAVAKLRNDPKISPLLAIKGDNKTEVLNQKILLGKTGDTERKGLLDKGFINHESKTIWPYDIKSTHSMGQFLINYYKFGYGYQGSWYHDLLQQMYPGYRVNPFRFIVVSYDTEEAPLIYKMTPEELTLYADGGRTAAGKRVIGWRETISEIEWHRKEKRWDYPKEYYEKGELIIDSVFTETDNNTDPF
jgi:hypothetical protein